jgi:lipopolysaccharide export system protein LptC
MWERWARGSLLGLTVILASFLFYLLVTRMDSAPPPSIASPGPLGRSDAGIDQFKFTRSRAGIVQWEVQADRARVFEAENRALLEQVRVTLFGAKGWELKLEGDEGTVDLTTKDFILIKHTGPIAVQLESGYTINTNHLAWKDEDRTIRTDDPITIVGHGLEVKGRGFVGRLDTEEFRILEDVHVAIVQ